MKPILFFIMTLILVVAVNATYKWRDNMKFRDPRTSIVALELRGETIGTGAFITQSSVITSANILDYLYANGSSYRYIRAHQIFGKPAKDHWVWCIRTIHDWNRYRSSTDYWVRQGFDRKNSPIHDVYVLGLEGNGESLFLMEPMIAIKRGTPLFSNYDDIWNWYRNIDVSQMFYNFQHDERPVLGVSTDSAIKPSAVLNPKDMYYAGFACCNKGTFEDKDKTLIIVEDIYLVDCDEWVPREWGYFICISLKDETRVPSAGTPLFYNGIVIGLASFTMTRNEETIQIFTDIRPYFEHLWVCRPTHMNIFTYKKYRYGLYMSTYIMPMIMKGIAVTTAIVSKEIAIGMAEVATEVFKQSMKAASVALNIVSGFFG